MGELLHTSHLPHCFKQPFRPILRSSGIRRLENPGLPQSEIPDHQATCVSVPGHPLGARRALLALSVSVLLLQFLSMPRLIYIGHPVII